MKPTENTFRNPENIDIPIPKDWRLITEAEFENWTFVDGEIGVAIHGGRRWDLKHIIINKVEVWTYITNRPLPVAKPDFLPLPTGLPALPPYDAATHFPKYEGTKYRGKPIDGETILFADRGEPKWNIAKEAFATGTHYVRILPIDYADENYRKFVEDAFAKGAKIEISYSNIWDEMRGDSFCWGDYKYRVAQPAPPAVETSDLIQYRRIGGFNGTTDRMEWDGKVMWRVDRRGWREDFTHAYTLEYCDEQVSRKEWTKEIVKIAVETKEPVLTGEDFFPSVANPGLEGFSAFGTLAKNKEGMAFGIIAPTRADLRVAFDMVDSLGGFKVERAQELFFSRLKPKPAPPKEVPLDDYRIGEVLEITDDSTKEFHIIVGFDPKIIRTENLGEKSFYTNWTALWLKDHGRIHRNGAFQPCSKLRTEGAV